MTWYKVDDGFHSSPKVLELVHARGGLAALGLWVVAGSWASAQLTGGRVPLHVVRTYATKATAEVLVGAGLWERDGEGYRFHDWDDYQPDADAVRRERDATRERVRRHREIKSNVTRYRGVTEAVTESDVTRYSNADVTPVTVPRARACAPARAGARDGSGSGGLVLTGGGVGEGPVVTVAPPPPPSDAQLLILRAEAVASDLYSRVSPPLRPDGRRLVRWALRLDHLHAALAGLIASGLDPQAAGARWVDVVVRTASRIESGDLEATQWSANLLCSPGGFAEAERRLDELDERDRKRAARDASRRELEPVDETPVDPGRVAELVAGLTDRIRGTM